jgi:hypothetical protein
MQEETRTYIEQVIWAGTKLIFICEIPHFCRLPLRFWRQKIIEQPGIAVTLSACIVEGLSSALGPYVGYTGWVFSRYFSVCRGKCWEITSDSF